MIKKSLGNSSWGRKIFGKQLPHMNTFQTNPHAAAGMGHSHVPHQYGPTSHHTNPPHDAKMAEKIVSELQVNHKISKDTKS